MARPIGSTAIHNIIRASKKRKGRAAALLNIFYFSLYDIGMARKSAHTLTPGRCTLGVVEVYTSVIPYLC